ncbi:GIY-YIG nuclease family protein [Halorubellus sp. JP-L1]|uniref:GIY-YIG nuclease family protein n=1 Tax=Halorubellus sp. JP-L1 TaxID=2715753 RepID=UPI00140D420F|nr:GIY-YIG nuclease family protein [Halorubellus sp. JP-L1]
MTGGTYSLVLDVARDATVDVGALGALKIPAGTYAYTGNAFGPGGFGRVDRHRELAAGDRDTTHWHVDYLLAHDAASVRDVVTTPGADVECAVAKRLPAGPGDGFGASDCACDGHLAAGVTRDAVAAAHRDALDDVE